MDVRLPGHRGCSRALPVYLHSAELHAGLPHLCAHGGQKAAGECSRIRWYKDKCLNRGERRDRWIDKYLDRLVSG